jgi:hypothetical protein
LGVCGGGEPCRGWTWRYDAAPTWMRSAQRRSAAACVHPPPHPAAAALAALNAIPSPKRPAAVQALAVRRETVRPRPHAYPAAPRALCVDPACDVSREPRLPPQRLRACSIRSNGGRSHTHVANASWMLLCVARRTQTPPPPVLAWGCGAVVRGGATYAPYARGGKDYQRDAHDADHEHARCPSRPACRVQSSPTAVPHSGAQ